MMVIVFVNSLHSNHFNELMLITVARSSILLRRANVLESLMQFFTVWNLKHTGSRTP